MTTKKHRQHWYRVVIESCPVCGRSTTTRVRVYGKRPRVRYRFVDSYDYCDAF